MVSGFNFDNQPMLAKGFGVVYRSIFGDGKLHGMGITYSGSTLTIAAGWCVACGRVAYFPAAYPVSIPGTSGFARVVLTVDLTGSATEDAFQQVTVTVQTANAVSGFPPLMTEDVNAGGLKYQIVLCVLQLGSNGVAGIVSIIGDSQPKRTSRMKLIAGVDYGSALPEDIADDELFWIV